MISFVEIHSLLQELEQGEVSAFFAYNEIKNILLDQREFSSLESLLRELLTRLSTAQKQDILPYLVTTPNARLNRYAIFELSTFITPSNSVAILHKLLDPLFDVPQDSYEALRENGVRLDVCFEHIEKLVDEREFMKLLYLCTEINLLSSEEIQKAHDLFIEKIQPQTKQIIHGIEIESFELSTLLERLRL